MAKDKVTLNINVEKGEEEKMKLTKVANAPNHKIFEANGTGFSGQEEYRGQIIHDGKRIITSINLGSYSETIIIKNAPGMTPEESVKHIQNSINGSLGKEWYIIRYDFLRHRMHVHYDTKGKIVPMGEIKIESLRKRTIEENEKYDYTRMGELHESDFLNMMVLETIAEHILISAEMVRVASTERRMEEFNKQFEGVKNTVEVAQKEAAKEMKDKIAESLKVVADKKTVVKKEEFDVNKQACVFFKNGTTKIALGVEDMGSLRKAFSVPDQFVKVGNLLVARDMVQMVELKVD